MLILKNLPQSFSYFRPSTEKEVAEARSLGYKEFIYQWLHVPTGKSGQSSVWCHSDANFLSLLREWNTEIWIYTPLAQWMAKGNAPDFSAAQKNGRKGNKHEKSAFHRCLSLWHKIRRQGNRSQ